MFAFAFVDAAHFDGIFEAQVLTHRWIRYYNQMRLHSSHGRRYIAPLITRIATLKSRSYSYYFLFIKAVPP